MAERLRCNDCHRIRHAGAALGRRLMIIPLWEKAPSPPLVFTDYIFLTQSFSPSVGIRSSRELHPEYAISKALVCISVWNIRVGDLSTWCHVKHQLGSKARQGLQTSTTSLVPPNTLLNVLVCQHGNYFSFISRRLIVVRNLWSLGQFGVYGAKEHQILAIIKNHKKNQVHVYQSINEAENWKLLLARWIILFELKDAIVPSGPMPSYWWRVYFYKVATKYLTRLSPPLKDSFIFDRFPINKSPKSSNK